MSGNNGRTRAAVLLGTGSALPVREVHNSEFEKSLDTSDEWIRTRTGITSRRIAGANETTAGLGLEASRKAIEIAGITAQDIDLIVCATVTPEMMIPSTACFLQAGLGCRQIGAFDLLAACSGFLYAMSVGAQYIRSGEYKHVLVVGSETLSRVVDFTDRGSCILFGDGAGAAVLGASDDHSRGFKSFKMGSDGSKTELLYLPGGGSRHPASTDSVNEKLHYLKINGREIYKFAVTRMQELLKEAMEENSLTVNDVAMVIPHQVNFRIIDSAVKHMGFPLEKVMMNLERYGNTSAASVPIAMDEALRAGRLKRGDTAILVAFGGGLTWSSAVITI